MKIDFPRIVRTIDLDEYAPEMNGQTVTVWVNPTAKTLNELATLDENKEESQEQFLSLFSDLLSQGEEETHFSVDDLKYLHENTPPDFWVWLVDQTFDAIRKYRDEQKKVLAAPLPS